MFVVVIVIVAGLIFLGLRALSNRNRGYVDYSNGPYIQTPIDPVYMEPGYGQPPNPMGEIATIVAAEVAVGLVEEALFDRGGGFDQSGFDQSGFDQSDFDQGGFDGGGDFF